MLCLGLMRVAGAGRLKECIIFILQNPAAYFVLSDHPERPLPPPPSLLPPASSTHRHLLVFNPNKRLSPSEALKHPYVAQFHNDADEPSARKTYVLPISDNTKYTVAEYR